MSFQKGIVITGLALLVGWVIALIAQWERYGALDFVIGSIFMAVCIALFIWMTVQGKEGKNLRLINGILLTVGVVSAVSALGLAVTM
ncbi:hypothetical protein B0H94_10272 [Salsuginibacillus halophilus]|uniref:Uncharacterized protein n=1 Tax=Salsuginibacillus halophilus TaxID=517424 RepID=A0A2P8HX43_9BACI|nr:hypothetical protein [Salsuginibacillus halophilus]PSL50796.1 hypothetical protein B0H94_10272 [Salsuginibacillus halophilus]